MLTSEQISIIRKYVPEKYFSQEKLIRYLSIHEKVGVEVFGYVAKKYYSDAIDGFETVLPNMFKESWDMHEYDPEKYFEHEHYESEDVNTFVKRIPFNFYHREERKGKEINGDEVELWTPVAITDFTYSVGTEPFYGMYNHRESPLSLEDMYSKLEFLFYDKGYSLKEIFDYPDSICWAEGGEIICDWFDYIDMCFDLGWTEYMPKNFYYKYNLARESLGKDPVVFMIQEYDVEAWARDPSQVQYYKRNGNQLEMFGIFPCDDEGNPVLRWAAVDIKYAEEITCSKMNELESLLTIVLGPKTVVRAKIQTKRDKIGNPIHGTEPEWVQLYAGPQNMTFNYKVLKERRRKLGYTQQDVADAVQANVRTYQKWENGETKPDGYYLLRLLNWLDITSINDVIIYSED